MKKTIARIMAAAMVVTSVVAPAADANAAGSIFAGTATAAQIYNAFGDYTSFDDIDGATIYDDDYNFEPSVSADEYGYYDALDLDLSEGTYTDGAYEVDTTYGSVVTATVEYTGALTNNVLDPTTNAVTSGTAASDVKEAFADSTADINALSVGLATPADDDYWKTVVSNGEFEDVVVARNVAPTDWIRVTWNNGVQRIWRNVNYANNAELVRQANAGNIIWVRAAQFVNGVRAGWVWVRFLNTRTATANDDYWNGIVKLKADNNRYTPIRVHVDAVDGSIAGLNGLYVQSDRKRYSYQCCKQQSCWYKRNRYFSASEQQAGYPGRSV